MIGDLNDDETVYKNCKSIFSDVRFWQIDSNSIFDIIVYLDFTSGCHPELTNVSSVIVQSVEAKMTHHLERECLGSPLLEQMSVKAIVDAITINQGFSLEGVKDKAFFPVVEAAMNMLVEK